MAENEKDLKSMDSSNIIEMNRFWTQTTVNAHDFVVDLSKFEQFSNVKKVRFDILIYQPNYFFL